MTEMTGSITSSADVGRSSLGGRELTHLSIRSEVIAQINQVAQEQDKWLVPLIDDLVLLDSGLDSLCFAVIVARLEDSLGVDPYTTAEDNDFPVTLGEFIKFYEDAAK